MSIHPALELDPVLFERSLALLERLTGITSASGDVAGLDHAAVRLGAELEARGLAVEIERRSPRPGARDLPILTARRGGTRDPLLLIGHLDTVLPARAPERSPERLVATGAIDMKGGFAAFAGALDLLAARGVAPPSLQLVAVPDEEVGGELSRALTAERGEHARALWVLEPGELRGAVETIVIGRRGLFDWTVEVRGRAAHSGLAFWEGRSAAAAAARWSAAAANLSESGSGPTINVARSIAGDADFVDDLDAQSGLLGSGRRLNVVADRATLEGEVRFLRAADAARVEAELRRHATEISARDGVAIELARGQTIAPVEPTVAGRAAAHAAVAAAGRRGWTLELESERGGVSFPNFLPDPARIPVLDGLGPVGGGMHTREEWVDLTSLARRIVLLADLLEREARATD